MRWGQPLLLLIAHAGQQLFGLGDVSFVDQYVKIEELPKSKVPVRGGGKDRAFV